MADLTIASWNVTDVNAGDSISDVSAKKSTVSDTTVNQTNETSVQAGAAMVIGSTIITPSGYIKSNQIAPVAIQLSLSCSDIVPGGSGVGSTFGYNDQSGQITFGIAGRGTGSAILFNVYLPYLTSQRSIYPETTVLHTVSYAFNSSPTGVLQINSDEWSTNAEAAATPAMYKNTSSISFSGTQRGGKLGYDPTNSYLLVLYSSTKIAKFSGVSGTTLTNLSSDVTLDNAVDEKAFIYDNANSRYICIDGSDIRRFNSSGTTIDTLSLDATMMAKSIGLCFIDDVVYVVTSSFYTTLSGSLNKIQWQLSFIPTTMTRY